MLATVVVVCTGYPLSGLAQPDDTLGALKKEIEALREGQTAIQRQLRELTDMLRGRGAGLPTKPERVVLKVDQAPFLGARNAKVTLVEFSDYQCPFCGRHFSQTWPRIVTEYVRTGKVKYVFRDFPIEAIHPQAFKAAEAAHCAGEQGRYWEMHDRLFANQGALALADLMSHAGVVGLDVPAFQRCLDAGKHASSIRADQTAAQEAGVTGTPSFFLGVTEPHASTLTAVSRIVGARSYEEFKEAIESLLSSPE